MNILTKTRGNEPRTITSKQLMESMPPNVRRNLRSEWRYDRYGAEFSHYVLDGTQAPDELKAALQALERYETPAQNNSILRGLTELRLLTRSRDLNDDDLKAQTLLYASRLAQVPADAALQALKLWSESSPWWPAWHDLQLLIDEITRERRSMKYAISVALRRSG